ncbi:MAG: KpsF/GutQ family sugar-phosphate isomerase [Kiritimatiellae bacterium]|nr:KpsF/GutQ family sugar-phosphate isomerase [Kiritimatiellia bacterium]
MQTALEIARETFDAEMEGLRKVRGELDDSFCRAVEMLRECLARHGKIVLTGVGKNLHIAEKVSATLASTGSTSVVLNPMQAVHGDLGILAAGDVLVALSYSGESDELKRLVPAVRRLGVPILAVTAEPDSSLGRLSQLVLRCAVDREACPFGIAPTASTTATLALGDALAMALLRTSGFKREDFAKLHPGGAIGRTLLLRASDLMRTGAKVAAVPPDARVSDTVVAMTHAKSGAAFAVDGSGVLLGIFTDGDFRRAVASGAPDVLSGPVSAYMTRNPVSVAPDALAVDVLRLLEHRAIDDVPVVEADGRLAGAIDIQDLPKFKVM